MKMRQLYWGIALILFGFIALASTLGLLRGINVWALIGPYFLIVLGVWFLLRPVISRNEKLEAQELSIPLEGATEAEIKLVHGAGKLEVHAGAEPDKLLSGTFVGGVVPTTHREGSKVNVGLKSDFDIVVALPPIPSVSGFEWALAFNSNIPLSLELESGASESVLDLKDLLVKNLTIETGASSTTVTLPAKAGFTKVKVESGAASVNLKVPDGVAAKIKVESAIASSDIDTQRFPRNGKGYRSADYDTAANKVDIAIETGVGSISVK
jgi:hypothetical protein